MAQTFSQNRGLEYISRRPGREANVIRSLVERHDGVMPVASVTRIWRELMAAACQMQAPFRIALHAPERSISHWDVVRNHFGTIAPIILCGSAQRVLQELETPGTIGVLPWPDHDVPSPWWPHMATSDLSASIVTALPFFESATGHFEDRKLMVVATYPAEESGDDSSYVVVQKYLHDLAAWNALPTGEQEAIVGRTKIDNVEIDDDDAPRKSHKSLATIEDDHGEELDILRDNMPFGSPGRGEFGTYFIGYSRRLWVIERMLERMFVGDPPGSYDRLLDFSTATTGTVFFAPSRRVLTGLCDG